MLEQKILDELIKSVKVRNIILEKIVFQKLNYFKKFIKISKKKKLIFMLIIQEDLLIFFNL